MTNIVGHNILVDVVLTDPIPGDPLSIGDMKLSGVMEAIDISIDNPVCELMEFGSASVQFIPSGPAFGKVVLTFMMSDLTQLKKTLNGTGARTEETDRVFRKLNIK